MKTTFQKFGRYLPLVLIIPLVIFLMVYVVNQRDARKWRDESTKCQGNLRRLFHEIQMYMLEEKSLPSNLQELVNNSKTGVTSEILHCPARLSKDLSSIDSDYILLPQMSGTLETKIEPILKEKNGNHQWKGKNYIHVLNNDGSVDIVEDRKGVTTERH